MGWRQCLVCWVDGDSIDVFSRKTQLSIKLFPIGAFQLSTTDCGRTAHTINIPIRSTLQDFRQIRVEAESVIGGHSAHALLQAIPKIVIHKGITDSGPT